MTKRLKAACISQNLFLDVLNGLAKLETIALPVTDELPEGTEIVRVAEDIRRNEWVIFLTHPSFCELPLGAEVPFIRAEQYQLFVRRSLLETHEKAE